MQARRCALLLLLSASLVSFAECIVRMRYWDLQSPVVVRNEQIACTCQGATHRIGYVWKYDRDSRLSSSLVTDASKLRGGRSLSARDADDDLTKDYAVAPGVLGPGTAFWLQKDLGTMEPLYLPVQLRAGDQFEFFFYDMIPFSLEDSQLIDSSTALPLWQYWNQTFRVSTSDDPADTSAVVYEARSRQHDEPNFPVPVYDDGVMDKTYYLFNSIETLHAVFKFPAHITGKYYIHTGVQDYPLFADFIYNVTIPVEVFPCRGGTEGSCTTCFSHQAWNGTDCAPAARCPPGEWQNEQKECVACSVCADGETTGSACTATSDTECVPCAVCPATETTSVKCTATQDTQCKPCTVCSGGTTVETACTPSEDTKCKPCTECRRDEIETGDCTVSVDRTCRQCLPWLFPDKTQRICTSKPCDASEHFDGSQCLKCPDRFLCDGGRNMRPCLLNSAPSVGASQDKIFTFNIPTIGFGSVGGSRRLLADTDEFSSQCRQSVQQSFLPAASPPASTPAGGGGQPDSTGPGQVQTTAASTGAGQVQTTPAGQDAEEETTVEEELKHRKLGQDECIDGMELVDGRCEVKLEIAEGPVVFVPAKVADIVIPSEENTEQLSVADEVEVNVAPSGWMTIARQASAQRQEVLDYNFDLDGTTIFSVQPSELANGNFANVLIEGICDQGATDCPTPSTMFYSVPPADSPDLDAFPVFVFQPKARVRIFGQNPSGQRTTQARRLLQASGDRDRYLVSWQRYYEARYEIFKCSVGSYLNSTTNSSCVTCPVGKTTNSTGATSASLCVCDRGSYAAADGGCTPCGERETTLFVGAVDAGDCVRLGTGLFESSTTRTATSGRATLLAWAALFVWYVLQ